MVAKRIIPCLDVKDGKTVKGINFQNLKEVGDAVDLGAFYAAEGADELVYLDISATREGRKTFTGLVRSIAERIDIPFTVGGGISSIEDSSKMIEAGADKDTVNSAAVRNTDIIGEIANQYGSQFIVVAIDAKLIDGKRTVFTSGGTIPSEKELFSWAFEAQERGAGEILFTSMDHDGTKSGYPCDVFSSLCGSLSFQVVASGGAGFMDDFAEFMTKGQADAALAASLFHYGEIAIKDLKEYLRNRGIPVRL